MMHEAEAPGRWKKPLNSLFEPINIYRHIRILLLWPRAQAASGSAQAAAAQPARGARRPATRRLRDAQTEPEDARKNLGSHIIGILVLSLDKNSRLNLGGWQGVYCAPLERDQGSSPQSHGTWLPAVGSQVAVSKEPHLVPTLYQIKYSGEASKEGSARDKRDNHTNARSIGIGRCERKCEERFSRGCMVRSITLQGRLAAAVMKLVALQPSALGIGVLVGSALGIAIHRKLLQTKVRSAKYFAGMIKCKPELMEQYMQLHDHTWDEVMARMYASGMRDFNVWYHQETQTMFHQWCYVGNDFEADMERVAADPIVRFWWTYCEPCQVPLHWQGPPPSQGGTGDPNYPGQWWSPLKHVNSCGAWATSWSARYPNPDFVPCHPGRLTSTKDNPPAVHNRTGPAAGWTSYKQETSWLKFAR